jgi:hypothetical protein
MIGLSPTKLFTLFRGGSDPLHQFLDETRDTRKYKRALAVKRDHHKPGARHAQIQTRPGHQKRPSQTGGSPILMCESRSGKIGISWCTRPFHCRSASQFRALVGAASLSQTLTRGARSWPHSSMRRRTQTTVEWGSGRCPMEPHDPALVHPNGPAPGLSA